jgi:hypothetical protein
VTPNSRSTSRADRPDARASKMRSSSSSVMSEITVR